MIRSIGVVIPAHNEQDMLANCLAALDVSISEVSAAVSVHVVVVLDDCSDRSQAIVARYPSATAITIGARNVGAARRAGAEQLLTRMAALSATEIWLATTDADSEVPPDWLTKQLDFATDGFEVAVGTIDVSDWSGQSPIIAQQWRDGYTAMDGHGHVHGANIGCTAAAYIDAGGWPELGTGEDVAFVAALAHRRVIRTAAMPVITSSRSAARATGGFSDYLRELAG